MGLDGQVVVGMGDPGGVNSGVPKPSTDKTSDAFVLSTGISIVTGVVEDTGD